MKAAHCPNSLEGGPLEKMVSAAHVGGNETQCAITEGGRGYQFDISPRSEYQFIHFWLVCHIRGCREGQHMFKEATPHWAGLEVLSTL